VERAKLVISLELKGMGEKNRESDRISTEGEIKQVVAGCPNSQIRDYNFYINLKDRVWKLQMIIELNQNFLEKLDARMMLIRYLLVISPTLNGCLQIVKSRQADTGDREWDAVRFQLESLLQMSVDNESVRLVNPRFEEGLKNFKLRFKELAEDIYGHAALVEKIEQEHFDGMEIVSRDPKHPTGVVARAKEVIDKIIENHNSELKEVVEGFNLLGMDLAKYKWDQLEEYLLEKDFVMDTEWVEKKLEEIEEEVRR